MFGIQRAPDTLSSLDSLDIDAKATLYIQVKMEWKAFPGSVPTHSFSEKKGKWNLVLVLVMGEHKKPHALYYF